MEFDSDFDPEVTFDDLETSSHTHTHTRPAKNNLYVEILEVQELALAM